jgi:dipeptidyl-peptidase-3
MTLKGLRSLKSFRLSAPGIIGLFHAAQKTWVQDKTPRVEHCMGLLFGYRDPYELRAE